MSDDMATTIEREAAQRPGRPSPAAPEQPEPAKSGGNKRAVFIIMGVVLLGLVAVGVRRWIYSLSHVSTDNAQVDGHIIPILPKVGGYVIEVRTDENRSVKAGDTLVVLDDRDYRARLAQAEADLAVALAGVSNRVRVGQAEAQVAQMQANAEKAHADLERIKPLAEKDIVPKQALDAAEAAARAADAGLAAAQRRVGHGEPEGDADGQRHSGRPRGFHGGRVPGAAREGARGEPVARDGGQVLAAAARQRDRQLHQGRAAHSGAHPARRAERLHPPAAPRHERSGHDHDQVMATAALPALGAAADADRYKYKYIIAITVSLASVLELLDTSIVNVAIPHMMGNLGATLDEIAWVSTGYIVANVIILPITGWLSAYFGRRRYFAGSIALFVLSSFFCGNAHTLGALVFWRIVQGLGGGALLSTSQAILYEEFPRAEYGTSMAIFGVVVMVGPTLGPPHGGYITDAFGWPWIFYINIPIGILALALSLNFIHNSRYQLRAERVDYIGLLLLAVGIGTLQTMLERGERLDWFDSREVTMYALISAASLIAFVWHELTTEHPVVDLRILKSRQLAVGVVFGLVLGVCLYATVFVRPVYLQNLQGFTAQQTGFVILPGALASAFTMATMGRFTGRFDARLSILAGVSIFALSMWKHAHFTTDSGMADFFWPLIFRGVGLGLIFVPLTNLALADLPMSMIPKGTPPPIAESKALAVLNLQVTKQAMMLSFEHLFLLFGACFVLSLPLLLLMHRSRAPGGGGMAH